MQNRQSKSILVMAQFSILLALEALMSFTPLGSIPTPFGVVASIGMLPVIISAQLLGTGAGTAMGFFGGLFSFMVWTFMPPNPLTAFLFTPFYSLGSIQGNFWSLVICFVPRILVGTFTGWSFKALAKLKKKTLAYTISGIIGSFTNTLLVVGGMHLFFGGPLLEMMGNTAYTAAMLGMLLVSGGCEAAVSAVAANLVSRPVSNALAKGAV